MEKIKIFYRSGSGENCPFCKNVNFPQAFMESNICGGYRFHAGCLERLREYKKQTGILWAVLAPDQDPNEVLDMTQYTIYAIYDNLGWRAQHIKKNK